MQKTLIFTFFLLTIGLQAQSNINVMFYNLLNYPTAPPSNRATLLKNILNTYEPDIFMVCELESATASDDILNFSLGDINKNYSQATFVSNQSDATSDSDLQQEIYYNNDYFILDNQQTILTNIRDINQYTFILKTLDYQTNPTYLEVFVTHLKSSQGTTNQQKRLQMVTQFTNALVNLPTDRFVIFAGDFNFYTSSEPGYQKILDNTNNILMKDVLNLSNTLQSWHNNYNWRHLHTQATRLSNSEFNGHGAYGGLDDRFDFIMLSENMVNGSDLYYTNNSYENYGNNNNCYNLRIDDVNCTGNYSQSLREDLYYVSDHLPVTLQLTSNQTLSIKNALINQDLIKLPNGNIITNELTLIINETILSENILIIDTLGKEVLKLKAENNLQIDTTLLAKGIYYVKATSFNETLKIIKI